MMNEILDAGVRFVSSSSIPAHVTLARDHDHEPSTLRLSTLEE